MSMTSLTSKVEKVVRDLHSVSVDTEEFLGHGLRVVRSVSTQQCLNSVASIYAYTVFKGYRRLEEYITKYTLTEDGGHVKRTVYRDGKTETATRHIVGEAARAFALEVFDKHWCSPDGYDVMRLSLRTLVRYNTMRDAIIGNLGVVPHDNVLAHYNAYNLIWYAKEKYGKRHANRKDVQLALLEQTLEDETQHIPPQFADDLPF